MLWYNFAMLNKEAIIQTLHEHQTEIRRFGVRRLGLFGSFARGEQKISSDLDFVVELAPKTFDAYMGLKNFLEELFGCRVDLVLPVPGNRHVGVPRDRAASERIVGRRLEKSSPTVQ